MISIRFRITHYNSSNFDLIDRKLFLRCKKNERAFPYVAMRYYVKNGLASGGDPKSNDEPAGCLPFFRDTNLDLTCPLICDSGAQLDRKFGKHIVK